MLKQCHQSPDNSSEREPRTLTMSRTNIEFQHLSGPGTFGLKYGPGAPCGFCNNKRNKSHMYKCSIDTLRATSNAVNGRESREIRPLSSSSSFGD